MQIDYVLPYVRPTENWLKNYKFITGKDKSLERFRDWNLIKYLRTSIEKYAPWINSVKLIVSNEDQVPDELKGWDKLDVILHKEFIPECYLPTFNSGAIEMFLPCLPRTSEYFIYGNDDFLFWNPCEPSDFFTEDGKPKIKVNQLKIPDLRILRNDSYLYKLVRITKLIYSKYMDIRLLNGPMVLDHGRATPGRLSYYKEAFETFKTDILDSLTLERNNLKNYNQYLFTYYIDAKGLNDKEAFEGFYLDLKQGVGLESLRSSEAKMICVNDIESTKLAHWKRVWDLVEKKLSL